MQEEIKNNLSNPSQLEQLYRDNKSSFKKAFSQLYPEISNHLTAQVWHERLRHESSDISWGNKSELIVVILLSLLGGFIAQIPNFFNVSEDFFYPRNITFVVFPMLTLYFAWKQSFSLKKSLILLGVFLLSALYINLLPNNSDSHTLMLASIHLPLFLWTVVGYSFTGSEYGNLQKRTSFLRYNGDLIILSAVIVIAIMILFAITKGLFSLINIPIEKFYFDNIVIWELAAAPIVATYLIQTNPQLVKNVSPIIAKVFTPVVMLTVIAYLIAIVYTGKDPYNDREFLILINFLLIGVMAIILFSVSETSKNNSGRFSFLMLFILSSVTVIINGIALSAILFRLFEWGITPNRLAVVGSNMLILINLLMVTYRLFISLRDDSQRASVENSIASFLPIYSGWALIVAVVFPVAFSFI
ncbi:DUF4153 domain-containing protein [Porphyromonadaceae bacterium]